MVQDNQALDDTWAFVIDDRASETKFTEEQERRIDQMRKVAQEALLKHRKKAHD